jgi:hypothetical protein
VENIPASLITLYGCFAVSHNFCYTCGLELTRWGGKTVADHKLIVNKTLHPWDQQHITGAQILTLAGSPAGWVVNQLLPGAGEDPEIANGQNVDLDEKVEPQGVKRFQTRKPATDPGSA